MLPPLSHMAGEAFSKGDLPVERLGKVIGDGASTRLWSDSWIRPEQNLKPIGHVLQMDQDLMVSGILSRETKEWNMARINSLMP